MEGKGCLTSSKNRIKLLVFTGGEGVAGLTNWDVQGCCQSASILSLRLEVGLWDLPGEGMRVSDTDLVVPMRSCKSL